MNKCIVILVISLFSCTVNAGSPIKAFQEDADLLRLEHLEYWTGLLDEYHKIKGHYPFQDQL